MSTAPRPGRVTSRLKNHNLYLRRRLSDLVETAPRLYRTCIALGRLNQPRIRRVVTPDHDVVIEGFPRCANSFAVRAFMLDNGWRDVRVATHVHSPAQIILATGWRIPTIVLVREPGAAVVSLLGFYFQMGRLDRSAMSPADLRRWIHYETRRYTRFYDRLMPYRDRFVIGEFGEVTSDFGAVVRRMNDKFGTDYGCFEHNDANVQKTFQYSKVHLSPNAARDLLKHEVRPIYEGEANRAARERAESVFAAFVGADVPATPALEAATA
jgi:hypothetical protein